MYEPRRIVTGDLLEFAHERIERFEIDIREQNVFFARDEFGGNMATDPAGATGHDEDLVSLRKRGWRRSLRGGHGMSSRRRAKAQALTGCPNSNGPNVNEGLRPGKAQ